MINQRIADCATGENKLTRRPSKLHSCMLALSLVVLIGSAGAWAQIPNRITRSIDGGRETVVASAHPMAHAKFDRGGLEGNARINRAAIVFKLSLEQQQNLNKLLREQLDPNSPNYHRWLTPEQYAAQFGMRESDLAQVTAWLRRQELRVDGYSRSRRRIFFSGTAAQVARAFGTEFRRYEIDGEIRFANAKEIVMPEAFAATVLGVRGFDNIRPRPHVRVLRPQFTSFVTGIHYVTPGDFATIYDVASLYAAGFDGTGQTLAVVGQTQIHTADVDAFRSAAGLPAADLQLVLVPGGGSGFRQIDEVESDLDVEWTGGVAKNATILFVYTGANSSKSVIDALEYSIDQNLAPVISMSYGACEAAVGMGAAVILQQDVLQANSQGQTLVASAGDSGAAGCDAIGAPVATLGLAVDIPAAIPEVTALGGSEFHGDGPGAVGGGNAGATTFWGGTTGGTDNVDSALSYIPEMAWNDTVMDGGLSATGGGVSTLFVKPAWQTSVTPADGQRDIPDISMNASGDHDGTLICSQAAVGGSSPVSCSSGFRASNGNLIPIAGTSAAAPTFAGILAILNQATHSSGQGNINSTLYTKAGTASFHDITTGDNKVPCMAATPDCTSGTFGYSAGLGYDLVTGLGSPDAHTLVSTWPGFSVSPDFSIGGTPVGISGPGGSGTSTIAVVAINGFTGTVDLGCSPSSLPAGTTCSFVPSSVSPGSVPGTSTLTIGTSSNTPTGLFNLIVTGVSGALSHSTKVTLTVSAPAAPDFNILLGVLMPSTITPGSSATSTITIVPLNGFAGTVNLACTVAGSGASVPTCALNPAAVQASGTSTLTISTTAPGGGIGTPTGNYVVAITGTSGSTQQNDSLPFLVQNPPGPDFQIAASSLSPGTVAPGASATSTISIIPTPGFTGTVNLTCSVSGGGTPPPTCSLNSSSVANGSGNSTLTVSTIAPHVIGAQRSGILGSIELFPAAVVVLGAGLIVRRRKARVLAGLLVFSALLFVTACGGGSKSSTSGGTGNGAQPGTPPGVYTITVAGTSGTIAHTTHLTLIL